MSRINENGPRPPVTSSNRPSVGARTSEEAIESTRGGSAFLGGGPVRGPNLSNAGYDHALFEASPFLRGMKAAVTGWTMPPAQNPKAPQLGLVLKADDAQLVPTLNRPGREGWQKAMVSLITSAGAKSDKPTAYYLAGPMGVGKIAAAKRFYDAGVLPQQAVKADSDYLHTIVPEATQLMAAGDGRAMNVVHEETALISRTAYAEALEQRRDVVHNSMFGTNNQLKRLADAKAAGFKRVTIALISELDVARARAGANGFFYEDKELVEGHQRFAANFDELVKQSDELVLVRNTGSTLELIGHGKNGELTVTNQASYDAFRAMANTPAPVEKPK